MTENKPLVDYTLHVPNPDPTDPESANTFPDSVYTLQACVTSRALKQLTCSCSFYTNFSMVCWHQLYLLERLQIKNMGAFEHLKKWREFVGYKSLNTNDKRTTGTYKIKKEKRLKSFIELVTKKHMKRLAEVAKEKGITLRSKQVGQQLSSGEENDWEELNRTVREREDAAAAGRRQKAKDKRLAQKAKQKASEEAYEAHKSMEREERETRRDAKRRRKELSKSAKKSTKKDKKRKDKKSKKCASDLLTRKRFRDDSHDEDESDGFGSNGRH